MVINIQNQTKLAADSISQTSNSSSKTQQLEL